MKYTRTKWEDSRERYMVLLEGVNELISNTSKLAETYEQTNMNFAHLIYENGLTQLMEKSSSLKEYERGFEFMHYSLKEHVENLKHMREIISLIALKDPINYPCN